MDTAFNKQEQIIEKVGKLIFSYPILQISNVHFPAKEKKNTKNRGTKRKKFEISYL